MNDQLILRVGKKDETGEVLLTFVVEFFKPIERY